MNLFLKSNILIVTLFSFCAWAEVTPAKSEVKTLVTEVKPNMSQFQILMTDLSPYLQNEKEFKDTQNKEKIQSILAKINDNIDLLKHKTDTKASDFNLRFRLLSEGFKDVEESFKNGFYDYSYWSLKSQVFQCSACHTEKQLKDRGFSYDLSRTPDLYDQAEFQYMLRNYTEAIPKFVQLVKDYPDNKLTESKLSRAVKKIAYYQIRVSKDDTSTLKTLNELTANKKLPLYLANSLKKWISYLEVKKYRIFPKTAEDQSLKQLNQFITHRDKLASEFGVGDERFLLDQETLIYLHEVLDQNNNKEITPWLYLWIGQLESDYRDSLFDNLGEKYLQECVKMFPKSKAAVKCKKALADSNI